MKEKGQIVVLLLLVIVVALAIGLSIISRSVLEVSTSRKSEDSSRAFSAAEAGIEKAILANINNLGGTPIPINPFDLGNKSRASEINIYGLPLPNTALAYPPFGKEAFAQFWLANPDNIECEGIPSGCYTQGSFNLYFGDPDTDGTMYETPEGDPTNQPAVEVTVIYWDEANNKYQTLRQYYDSFKNTDGTPNPRNADFVACDYPPIPPITINTNYNTEVSYYCKVEVTGYPNTPPNSYPIMVRVRLLYTETSHPVALEPYPISSSLPKQADLYQSSGTSGEVMRKLEVTRFKQSMPQIFDYVLFSAKDLNKNP